MSDTTTPEGLFEKPKRRQRPPQTDELARLRAEVKRLEEDKQAIQYCNDTQAGVIDALRARVEKLEGALKPFVCDCSSNCAWERDEICPDWNARAALGDTHE